MRLPHQRAQTTLEDPAASATDKSAHHSRHKPPEQLAAPLNRPVEFLPACARNSLWAIPWALPLPRSPHTSGACKKLPRYWFCNQPLNECNFQNKTTRELLGHPFLQKRATNDCFTAVSCLSLYKKCFQVSNRPAQVSRYVYAPRCL